ncbi:hypothetical protein [Streptomyces sp. NPDC054784]
MRDGELRTDTDTCRPDPTPCDSERDSRPDTERRDDCERTECDERDDDCDDCEEDRDDGADVRDDGIDDEPDRRPPRATERPVGAEPMRPSGETTGARPHVSQYSSPSPMSS